MIILNRPSNSRRRCARPPRHRHALAHWPSHRPDWTFTTALMMVPGYRVRTWDALLTNFHQPGSTLLMLVASVLGDSWKSVYDHALNNDYRFLSYGDASLLWRE